MNRVGVVILNYLNYNDTIECVESLMSDTYGDKEVIIVDNGSSNESWEVLFDRYNGEESIYLIQSDKNEGFARGNNIGIVFARIKLGCNHVLLLNNDTIITENNMIQTLVDSHEENIGIIAANGYEQNPVMRECTKETVLERINYQPPKPGIIKSSWLWKELKKFNALVLLKKKLFNREKLLIQDSQESIDLMLHGACMFLTKDYFEYYPFLFPKTFLYYEENILLELTRKVGLTKKFINVTSIYHKEDQSSEMSFKNESSIKAEYELASAKRCLELFDMSYKEVISKYF